MASVANKRSVMTLYSSDISAYSHRVRVVLAEKGAAVDIVNVDLDNKPEALLELNPYGLAPTLVDRDLVLYESRIVMEYLDERFPHPPLMPVYPVARAQSRLMLHRIDLDWYSHMAAIMHGNVNDAKRARRELYGSLVALEPVFSDNPYFLSEEFTLVDCSLAVLLWRLPLLGIELPTRTKGLCEYTERLFQRESFQASLTDAEREIRE